MRPLIEQSKITQSVGSSDNCSAKSLMEVVVIPTSKPNLTEVVVHDKERIVSIQVVANSQFVRPDSPLPASLNY